MTCVYIVVHEDHEMLHISDIKLFSTKDRAEIYREKNINDYINDPNIWWTIGASHQTKLKYASKIFRLKKVKLNQ